MDGLAPAVGSWKSPRFWRSETAGELIRVLEVFPPQLQTFSDPPTGTNTTLVSPRRFDKEVI